MKRLIAIPSVLMAILAIAGCVSTPTSYNQAEARLEARSGSSVSGIVNFKPMNDGRLHVTAQVAGLTPGEHGFHIHESGDCSAPDAMSAKGHFNPATTAHGYYKTDQHHAGDMPNLVADKRGNATLAFDASGLSLNDGGNNIVGRSVVIHADPDDYKTQPAGNSGKRVACGTIRGL